MERIGQRLRYLREQRGLSLRELGKRLNIAHSHLSGIETGKKKPNLELLNALARVFDVKMSEILGEYTEDEQDFMDEAPQLTLTELMNKYDIVVGDRPATQNEIEEAIKYILIKRQMESSN